MKKWFAISTRLGMARAEIDLPEHQIELWELPELLWPLAEACEALAREANVAAGKCVSCKAGCGACCRQLVCVSSAEAEMLRREVETMPEQQRDEIKARFATAESKLRAAGLW